MTNDAVSAIDPIIAVSDYLLNLVLGEGDANKLLATPARNSQAAIACILHNSSILVKMLMPKSLA